jgi:hypothetical protein
MFNSDMNRGRRMGIGGERSATHEPHDESHDDVSTVGYEAFGDASTTMGDTHDENVISNMLGWVEDVGGRTKRLGGNLKVAASTWMRHQDEHTDEVATHYTATDDGTITVSSGRGRRGASRRGRGEGPQEVVSRAHFRANRQLSKLSSSRTMRTANGVPEEERSHQRKPY